MALMPMRIKVGERWFSVRVGDITYSPVEVTVEGETISVEVEGSPTARLRGPPGNAGGQRESSRRPGIATPPPVILPTRPSAAPCPAGSSLSWCGPVSMYPPATKCASWNP